jgi:hypothetical protein
VPIPKIAYCAESVRLLQAFLQAIHELNGLQAEQTQCVIDGDADFARFDLLLHYAQEKKDTAKYAWIAHVEEHRCNEAEYEESPDTGGTRADHG